MENQEVKVRVGFGGKTTGFANKEERNFEKAHLKAYLKGKKVFNHGFKDSINGRIRAEHQVIELTKTIVV